MKNTLPLALVLLVSIPAFAESPSDKETTLKASICSGNDANGIDEFDATRPLPLDVVMTTLHKQNNAKGCKRRYYNINKKQSAKLFKRMVRGKFGPYSEDTQRCWKSEMKLSLRMDVLRIIEDPKNIAVIADLFDPKYSDENEEACAYFHFYVYRPDGTLLTFVFNYTT